MLFGNSVQGLMGFGGEHVKKTLFIIYIGKYPYKWYKLCLMGCPLAVY